MRQRLARLLGRGGGGVPPDSDDTYAAIARLAREGPAPLVPGRDADGPLRVAIVVPDFRRGSGGHTTIANIVRGLEQRGHECSIWIYDPWDRSGGPETFRRFFGPFAASVHPSLDGFTGADVVVATGWHTVAPVLLLEGCAGRAYLVQDHEPDFFPASAHRLWARDTYRQGLHCITAGTWLADLMREYGATATPFALGIDHATYRPQDAARADARVVFYARAATARRAVPLGLLALAELKRRRPDVEIVLFGDPQPTAASFDFRHLAVAEPDALARVYSEATVGMVFSLTNYSLVGQEMAACGLPAVELDLPGTRAAFGADGPLELVAPTTGAVADALERLLADPALRAAHSRQGLEWAASRTWERAAVEVEEGLRTALRAGAQSGGSRSAAP